MARYSQFVLIVPLNSNQPTKLYIDVYHLNAMLAVAFKVVEVCTLLIALLT